MSHNIEQTSDPGAKPQGTQLLDRGLSMIDLVAAEPGRLRAGDIAGRLGLTRSTAYRILGALNNAGMIRLDPVSQTYVLGPHLFDLARGGDAESWPGAREVLQELRDQTGETVYLHVPDGDQLRMIDRHESAHPLRTAAALGSRRPLHAAAAGKAFLAFLDARKQAALLRAIDLTTRTARTITRREVLLAQLELVRRTGYAIDDEEVYAGIRCCGAPVLDENQEPIGAISVSGPAYRVTMERLAQLGPEVAAAARRIGKLRRPQRSGGATAITTERAFEGQAPFWDGGAVLWVDALAPAIYRSAPDGANEVIHRHDAPLIAAFRVGNALHVMARNGAFVLTDTGPRPRATHGLLAGARFAAATADGAIWLAIENEIHRLDAHDHARREGGVGEEIAGFAWSRDGATLHVLDAGGRLHDFARDGAGLRAPVAAGRVRPPRGRAVGLAIDDRGRRWVALHDGWAIARLDADGAVTAIVSLPVPRPTNLIVNAGAAYVTTARMGLGGSILASAPLSGALLSLANLENS